MSIDYTAVPKRSEAYLDILWSGGEGEVITLDRLAIADRLEAEFSDMERFRKDYAAIAKYKGISEQEARTLHNSIEFNWELDGYIQVTVFDTEVGISHGFGGGERQMDTLVRLLESLQAEGLHIWDPQSGQFLPPG